jgi:hypothetical protein
MSSREVKRGTVLARVKAGDVPLGDAAQLLGVSYRQAKRLYARYRRDPHAAHQRARMQTAHADVVGAQEPRQHAAPGERQLQVQRIQAAHQCQIRRRHRARRVIHRRARELQQPRLPRDGELVGPIDHRFALEPGLRPSAPAKKSISSACWPILACSAFTSTGGVGAASGPPFGREDRGGLRRQLGLPLHDLAGVHIKPLGQLRQHRLVLQRR